MKNKLLIFLLLFIFILFYFSSFSFASDSKVVEFNYNSKDFTITLPSGYGTDYNYYMVVAGTNSSGTYLDLLLTTFPFSFNSGRTYIIADDDGFLYSDIIRGSSESWYERDLSSCNVNNFGYSVSIRSMTSGDFFNTSSYNLNLVSVVSSNFNIYDSEGELVFQPPLPEIAVLPGITQVEEIPRAVGEILGILIRVGLIVLSIGLVIFLMRFLVLRTI